MKIKFLFLITLIIILNKSLSSLDNKENNNKLWKEINKKENKINLNSISTIIKNIKPSILVINSKIIDKKKNFKEEYNFNKEEEIKKKQGSGFIINKKGIALTNYHVVNKADEILVKVGNSLKTYKAEIIGKDKNTDIALIQIQSYKKNWPVIPLGDSKKVKVGDFSIAIGNPLFLELSASMGIVSAKGRKESNSYEKKTYFDFIQIDNAMNPGNSGGPLVNLNGEVIGINTAIAAGQGVGFAIPINQIKKIILKLKKDGKFNRAYLGVIIQDIDLTTARALGLPNSYGVLIREILKNSPAHASDLKPGDVIIKLNKKNIETMTTFRSMVGNKEKGEKIFLSIIRKGKEIEKNILLEDNEINKNIKDKNIVKEIGIKIKNLKKEELIKLNNLKIVSGILITDIEKNSVSEKAGMKKNDIIFKINDILVENKKKFKEIIKNIKNNEIIKLNILRNNSKIFVIFEKK